MPKIRYYADEHVSKAVTLALRQRGVDVLTVAEAGRLGATDVEQLMFAAETGRVVVTQDADFLILAASGIEHSGIVYARQHTSSARLVHGLMLVFRILEPSEMSCHVEYLWLAGAVGSGADTVAANAFFRCSPRSPRRQFLEEVGAGLPAKRFID